METPETGVRRTARGLAARARIVGTAAGMIHSRGVANTSLDEILAASDTSKSQLYHYFKDKDDLVLAVIQHQAEFVLGHHETLLRGMTSLDDLRRWRDAVIDMVRRDNCKNGCPLGTLVAEMAQFPRPRLLLAKTFVRWESTLAKGFTQMRACGELRPGADPATLATAMIAALQGGLLLAQVTHSVTPLQIALDMAIAHVTGTHVSTA